jgi:hypothetical protein
LREEEWLRTTDGDCWDAAVAIVLFADGAATDNVDLVSCRCSESGGRKAGIPGAQTTLAVPGTASQPKMHDR